MPRSGEDAAQVDADPTDGRNETQDERMDRNWEELLQELRVTQTGNQILTAFLFAVAFQPRFTSLDAFERTVYLCVVVVAALTTALGLAPVTLHRRLFRRHVKQTIVRAGHIIVQLVMVGVGLVLTGVVLLIFDVVLGRTQALVAAGSTVVVLLAIAAFPLLLRPDRGPGEDRSRRSVRASRPR